MTDRELEELLKRARGPERPAEFWEQFPGRVLSAWRATTAAATNAATTAATPAARSVQREIFPAWRWAAGLAVACVVFGLVFAVHQFQNAPPGAAPIPATQIARARKLFFEVSALFPQRVRGIILDTKGVQMVLSDSADVPASAPVWLEICRAGQCRQFITFSGQQVPMNGETVEVLDDGRGHVLLVGPRWVWSSEQPRAVGTVARIRAQTLEDAL